MERICLRTGSLGVIHHHEGKQCLERKYGDDSLAKAESELLDNEGGAVQDRSNGKGKEAWNYINGLTEQLESFGNVEVFLLSVFMLLTLVISNCIQKFKNFNWMNYL